MEAREKEGYWALAIFIIIFIGAALFLFFLIRVSARIDKKAFTGKEEWRVEVIKILEQPIELSETRTSKDEPEDEYLVLKELPFILELPVKRIIVNRTRDNIPLVALVDPTKKLIYPGGRVRLYRVYFRTGLTGSAEFFVAKPQ